MARALRRAACGGAGAATAWWAQRRAAQAQSPQRLSCNSYQLGLRFPKGVPGHWGGDSVCKNTQAGLSKKWKLVTLKAKLPLNHNTCKFVFEFPHPETEYRLPTCTTLEVGMVGRDGSVITRLYTPVTRNGTKGYFELVVKEYPGGLFTPQLFTLEEGAKVFVKTRGLKLRYEANRWQRIGLIAGGTGLTPMLQLIREVLGNPEDRTRLTLLACNDRACDMILHSELARLERRSGDRLKVVHCLQHPPLDWDGETGHVTPAMIHRHMPPPARDNLVCVCGPDAMMHEVAGCDMQMMRLWHNYHSARGTSGALRRQPGRMDSNNANHMNYCALAVCGYTSEDVYRF